MQIRHRLAFQSLFLSLIYLGSTTWRQIIFYTKTKELPKETKKNPISLPRSTLLGLPRIACRPVARCTAAVAYTSTGVMFTGGVGTRSNGYGLLHQYWVNVKRIDIPRNGQARI